MSDLFEAAPAKPKRGRAAKPDAAPEQIPASESTVEGSVGALVETVRENPVVVFTDEEKFSQFHQKLKAEVDRHVPDLTTKKGRDAVASLAFRVTKAKTTLVAAGKGLTEEWRKQTALVNASAKKMEAELDALSKETRRPLTEWEEKEKTRVAANGETIAQMRRDTIQTEDDTSDTVEARGRAIDEMRFDPPQWTEEEADQARQWQNQSVQALLTIRNILRKQEVQEAELARLRAEAEERAERDRIEQERLAQVEADRVAEEARVAAIEAEWVAEQERLAQAERDRLAAEQAHADRIEAARVEAAAQAQREADERAEAERVRVQQEHDEAIAAAQAERDRIAAEAEADRQRAADAAALIEQDRERERAEVARAEAERQRVADEAVARAEAEAEALRVRTENIEHRRTIKTAVKEAMMESGGITEDQAVRIVTSIIAGDVPHTTVAF